MNTINILQKSWNLMRHYRALWIFGVLLALTTISFDAVFWSSLTDDTPDRNLMVWELSPNDQAWIKENFGLDLPLSYSLHIDDLTFRLDDPLLSRQEKTRLAAIAISVLVGILALWALSQMLHYTAETALITMVNDNQVSKKEYTTRQGWSLGFSIKALKLFLIDLLVIVVLLTITPLLILPSLLPLLIAISGKPAAVTVGILLMISLLLVCVAAIIVLWIAGLITLRLAHRACCLDGSGVFASIWQGFNLLRTQRRDIGLTWIFIAGLELVYPILAAPVGLLLAAVALTASGLLALILGSLLALMMTKTIAWTIALIVGVVLLVLAVVVPLTFLSGLRYVFESSAWTLTFMEAVSRQDLRTAPAQPSALPQLDPV